MRVLVVKMSSMGDVFHTFPALSDAMRSIPGLQVDWIVEKSFAEIPEWHPVVNNVFSIELRKWRRTFWKKQTRQAVQAFFQQVNQHHYDFVIDAQGLLKSLWVVRNIQTGTKVGFDWKSAREPLASLGYQQKVHVPNKQHAIERLRQLFSKALNYDYSLNSPIRYELNTADWSKPTELTQHFDDDVYSVFLHGTTWDTKLWPEEYWVELLQKVVDKGRKVVLPWGNQEELERAKRIANSVKNDQAWVPDVSLGLTTMARILKFSDFVVSVDTGLSHVAAALDVPMVVLYRVTDSSLVGAKGEHVMYLESALSKQYIKKFKNAQQYESSLVGLTTENVLSLLKGKVTKI
ncbi:Lipopolysaccharide heptosyltransferase 1 [Hydrogenovibrio crunogenus]|uniref:Lipopolysaccharide heptosyltransferase 1 n=1 Tax=Hydrogenovibrio crunogenus TaxID=39765 RepID=A0A4P7P079_9GAMM|nr:lipopolysaccharide heptosyltransferase I [Hydrogenovibrio crunogenus]QBZ83551.1 Lipopolysaccharide heptosyltransferase 1 [Hydrogenovibrio crunogenus]